jgi:hypothetical protein
MTTSDLLGVMPKTILNALLDPKPVEICFCYFRTSLCHNFLAAAIKAANIRQAGKKYCGQTINTANSIKSAGILAPLQK